MSREILHQGCVITLFQQFVGHWISHIEPGPERRASWGVQFDIVASTERQALGAAKAEILHLKRYDRIDDDPRYTERLWRRKDRARLDAQRHERSYLQPGWHLPEVEEQLQESTL